MNHMILSCVQCGLCEQACPGNIPLLDLLAPVAEKAQSTFNYSPGKNSDDELPLAVYREDEYENVGVE
jgi:formate dehydrogenase subunit beta